ncbi:hypothetical protein GA0074696_0087 [Micromonospora purpureochromogenes]|uniref:PH domain-containing protein n=1 Tax=Micromonospora purpureochromogenes TaxID=47872 RepID=A0A1C4U3J8_9ACTN|nr:hypothetical protein [Micromonospora purpureochromogenes]SCE66226.1 hypothetical protein GA0074696_0087 [Micromonospora purpureochromogenes]
MQQKLQTRAFEHVTPILQSGEQPVVATRAMVGKFSSGRLRPIVSQAMRFEGGALLGAALAATSKQFVVLTNRRLIFLEQTFLGGPGKKVLGEVPREQVSLAEAKIGVVSLLRLAFGTPGDGVALTFPRIDKKNAESLAEALRQAPAA